MAAALIELLEAIDVVAQARRRGLARAPVARSRAWGCARGCSEFASDALLDNEVTHAMRRALGLEETRRVVYFRQSLAE